MPNVDAAAPSAPPGTSAASTPAPARGSGAAGAPRRSTLPTFGDAQRWLRGLTPLQIALAVWLAGALLVILRLAAGTVGVWRLASRGRRVDDGNWLSLAQRIATRLGISRPLTLLEGGTLGVPVTWGIVYPVVLLPKGAEGWDAERRRYVLVHEMAHVRRFDALTQLLGQLAVALFWFNPLVWLAAARMRLEREHACDDYVLREGTLPSRYAHDLLAMVRALGTPAHRAAQPAFAALAMARRSEFEGRMLAILDTHHDRHPLSRRGVLMLATAVLILVAPLAALRPLQEGTTVRTATVRSDDGQAQRTTSTTSRAGKADGYSCDSADLTLGPGSTSTHIHSDDDGVVDARQTAIVVTTPGRCVEARVSGDITFSDDERSVVRVAPAATAFFRERLPGSDRAVRVVAAQDGAVEHRAFVDGRAAPYDDAMRSWLAGFLPQVLRESNVNVRPRVARIRAQGGVPAVLSEISRIRSNDAKRAHFDALITGGKLSAADVERVARQAGRELSSSGDLSAVLRRLPRGGTSTPAARAALVESIGRIGSSGDRASTLTALVPTADRELLLSIAEAAKGITSSGDRSGFLRTAASSYLTPNDAALRSAYFAVAATVPSSGDLSGVLENALPYGHAAPAVTVAVLETAGAHVASSSDKTRVLLAAVSQRLLTTAAAREAYLNATRTLKSSSDYRTAREALVQP